MTGILSERDWETLLNRAARGKLVPLLGAGACFGSLPLGGEIAREWAAEYHYPFPDDGDLVKVATYLAIELDAVRPKELILDRLKGAAPLDFRAADEPHAVLADLPLPVYLTTNYDDFMVQALAFRRKDPRREFCRWNELVRGEETLFDREPAYKPTVANPLVYHLHGHTRPESVVLTEDDYLTFLSELNAPGLLPPPVREAVATSSLLFLGYRLADWNVRVLLQGLRRLSGANRLSLMVLVPPDGPDGARQKVQDYLDHYYAALDLRVYWGTARAFCGELARRWKQHPEAR